MKVNAPQSHAVKEHVTGVMPRPTLTPEERIEQRKRDKEFMRIMNEIVAEHGILTEDEWFRVI